MPDSGYLTSEQFEKFLRDREEEHKHDKEAGAERGREIRQMLDKQDKMQTSIDSIHRWRPSVDQKLTKYDHILFGNGEPGWDEILRRLVGYVDKQEKKEEAAWSDAKKFAIGIAAFVVNTLLALWISGMFGK